MRMKNFNTIVCPKKEFPVIEQQTLYEVWGTKLWSVIIKSHSLNFSEGYLCKGCNLPYF